MANSILILLHLPDDGLTPKTRNKVFSTALQAFSHHHILFNLPTSLSTRATVLLHTITHCNLSFKQRKSATNIRTHTMYLHPYKEDTGKAYFESYNGSQKSSQSKYIFSTALAYNNQLVVNITYNSASLAVAVNYYLAPL